VSLKLPSIRKAFQATALHFCIFQIDIKKEVESAEVNGD